MPVFFYYLGTFIAGWCAGNFVGGLGKKLIFTEMSILTPAEREKAIVALKANRHLDGLDLTERDYARMATGPMPKWAQDLRAKGHMTVVVQDSGLVKLTDDAGLT
jgi:hypothetical protein